ncbi:hypothetical protein ACMFMF_002164 [Clarireedia jacksonii]
MTRDTPGPLEGRNSSPDDDILAALWAAAPIPRLPRDAPEELKSLTIDVDDPKQVYILHHANRRHNFQLLVERRLAGAAPIRRYNSTSARILAIHLASQDDPEKGLCHHPASDAPIYLNKHVRLAAQRSLLDGRKKRDNIGKLAPPLSRSPSKSDDKIRSSSPGLTQNSLSSSSKVNGVGDRSNNAVDRDGSAVTGKSKTSILEEYTTTDHKSFIQNMFGTVAFKMVEWLTPRNLEALTRPEDQDTKLFGPVSPLLQSSPSNGTQTPSSELGASNDTSQLEDTGSESTSPGLKDISGSSNIMDEPTLNHRKVSGTRAERKAAVRHLGSNSDEVTPNNRLSSKVIPNGDTHVATATPRRKTDLSDSHVTKGILNLSTSARKHDTTVSSPIISSRESQIISKHKPQQQVPSTSSALHLPTTEGSVSPARPYPSEDSDSKLQLPTTEKSEFAASNDPVNKKQEQKVRHSGLRLCDSSPHDEKLPQSLSLLPVEVINLICDILQDDSTCEQHELHPERIDDNLKRYASGTKQLRRINVSTNRKDLLRKHWQQFIHQSLFSVLSTPSSLIKSFSYQNGNVFDSQTAWYSLLRMTRVAPVIVFDSLWIAAGTLFKPPKQLDWAKDPHGYDMNSESPLSKTDAARVINVCLHALVAAAPLVHEARQLANMSRIRSYGTAMLGRESSALESIALCLRYDDAFTNDLIMRLARRVFAAIPTRRRFAELLELQHDIRGDGNEQDDVLELVLDTLKVIDLDTQPILNFTDAERNLHEKRIPTLILDWARTVMLQDWDGKAEVPSDGSFGGALATIAAIYKNRKSLLLGDIHFRTEYFSERLDSIAMPTEWMSFHANRKTVHLLDYPYLFNPETLVIYFRAINYSRMNQSFEEAKSMQGLIRATIAHDSLMTDEAQRYRLYDRMSTATSRFLVLSIRRDHVLLDTFNSIWRREERELMRPLKIRLGEEQGEEGFDLGGIQQEFFRLAIAEALNPDYGTFTIDPRTKMTWFQPGSPEPLWKFELIGLIMSLAVYNGLTLPVTFPKALYRKLLGESITELHHISDGWPDLANGLTSLLEWDEKDGSVEDVFCRTYEFTVEQFGQPISRDMSCSTQWPQFAETASHSNPADAPLVTHENRNSYVSDYIQWLTDISVRPQFDAFKRGFFTCVDPRSITLFDPDTLQSLIEGVQDIDINEMRRNARYTGWSAGHRTVKDFWAIVKKFDLGQKRKLLEFVTASDRVPVGGMRALKFDLQKNGVDDDHLPSSYTCFGVLLLPEYSSREVLREKLEMALENSKGFGNA